MLAAQATREQRLAVADDVILNNSDIAALAQPGRETASAVLGGGASGTIGEGRQMSPDGHDPGASVVYGSRRARAE